MKPWLLSLVPLMLPWSAMAHATLEHAEPSAGAVLQNPPTVVRLQFSEALQPGASGASVTDSGGHSVSAAVAAVSGSAMSIKVQVEAEGEYRVKWHAVSVDGHRTTGSYTFSVAQ